MTENYEDKLKKMKQTSQILREDGILIKVILFLNSSKNFKNNYITFIARKENFNPNNFANFCYIDFVYKKKYGLKKYLFLTEKGKRIAKYLKKIKELLNK